MNRVSEDIAAQPPRTTVTAQQAVNAWNLRHPAGTEVAIHGRRGTPGRPTVTRSAAWVHDGTPVINTTDQLLPVELAWLEPVTESVLDGAA